MAIVLLAVVVILLYGGLQAGLLLWRLLVLWQASRFG